MQKERERTMRINEAFYTIQGEAEFTGTPAVFVRLQGCAVGCGWCDTKHTWDSPESARVSKFEVIEKRTDSEQWGEFTAPDVLSIVKGLSNGKARHVVITGGEPAEQDLTEVVLALDSAGYTIQIETSGTSAMSEEVYQQAWITLSPKINMAGGLKVLDEVVASCNEIKMPVGKKKDLEVLAEFLKTTPSRGRRVWLQPLSQSKKATEICVAAALENNWQLSLQTHKVSGVR